MNSPEERTKDLGGAYRKRKKLVSLSSVPFFVLAAVALLSRITSGRFLGIPFSIAGPVAFVTFLATFIAHVLIWRCPACGGYLGIVGSSKFCPKCGARLGGDTPGESGDKGLKAPADPGLGFKIWTVLLSVFVAVLLFPNIVHKHGVKKSLLITFLAVCAIWLMYFIVGGVIAWAVSEELKRRGRKRGDGPKDPTAGEDA